VILQQRNGTGTRLGPIALHPHLDAPSETTKNGEPCRFPRVAIFNRGGRERGPACRARHCYNHFPSDMPFVSLEKSVSRSRRYVFLDKAHRT
jgi:hypothetical protein